MPYHLFWHKICHGLGPLDFCLASVLKFVCGERQFAKFHTVGDYSGLSFFLNFVRRVDFLMDCLYSIIVVIHPAEFFKIYIVVIRGQVTSSIIILILGR